MAKSKSKSTSYHNINVRLDSHYNTYVDVRVSFIGNKNKTIDVAIYESNGKRLKSTPEFFQNGEFIGGREDVDELNIYIDNLTGKMCTYLQNNPSSTKRLIEVHLYGANLAKWQSKRIEYRDVVVYGKATTEYYKKLRALNLKKKVTTKQQVSTVENEFEVIKHVEKEEVIDPLSLEDFPRNFTATQYEEIKEKIIIRNPFIRITAESMTKNVKHQQQLINIYIRQQLQKMLYSDVVQEVVRIDKKTLREYKRRIEAEKVEQSNPFIPKFVANKVIDDTYLLKLKSELEQKEKEREVSKLSKDERYKQGEFDLNNLFEVFVSGFYLKYPRQINKRSILWRLLEYKFRVNPPSRTQDFDVNWCKNFLKYIFENGVVDKNFRQFEPSPNLPAKVFQGKILYYSKDRYTDVIKWFKDAIKKLTSEKRLPKIDLDEISVKEFYTKEELRNVDDNTQDEKVITKVELDKLYSFKFSTEELSLTRDRFILMLMFGGLRINEFRPDRILTGGSLQIEDDGYGGKFVSYYTSHNHKLKEMANPLNEYTESILKKYDYQIPFYRNRAGVPSAPDESHFNKMLKVMAKEIGIFKRRVKDKQRNEKGVIETVKISIEDDITSLYARHSIYPIFERNGIPHDVVKYFVGHSGRKDSSHNYNPKYFKNVAYKRDFIEKNKIRPE